MALVVTTWLWGEKYHPKDVKKLFAAVSRNLTVSHRKLLVTDWPVRIDGVEVTPIPDVARYLIALPGCLARLVVFKPEWQKSVGIGADDNLLSLDLDMVIPRNIDHVAGRKEPFVILQGINGTNPCPNNGSVWKLRGGYRPDVWSEFTVEKSRKAPFHSFPDDQGWFWHKLPDAAAYGPDCGVYGFMKRGWPGGEELPKNACIVAFPGFRHPAQFTHLPWVKEHWR